MLDSKIGPKHLQKNAYVYLRQSTPSQIMNNKESTDRQYRLKDKALAIGWEEEKIIIIDEDLGLSGKSANWRNGFQYLISEVSMAKSGVVLALEVSRLARNSADWHRLLEICAMTDTLIIDEDGVYDPIHFNDRFLLGMKGQMSEAESHIIRARLQGGILNKAKRGELKTRLPVGLLYDQTGKVVLDHDKEIQLAINQVFDIFSKQGSIRKVVKYFFENDLLFPIREMEGINKGNIIWRTLPYNQAANILKNPRYAGAYFFGRNRVRKNPLNGKKKSKRLEQKDWKVLLFDHNEGYISWEDFEANQKHLKANSMAYGVDKRMGPPREGPALLQGIAICGKCGRPMSVRYHKRKEGIVPDYYCRNGTMNPGGQEYHFIPGKNVDKKIEELLLKKLTPESIDIALQVFDKIQTQKESILKGHKAKISRLQYEAELAQRQYMYVDPANRLVASTLEKNWNVKLLSLQTAKDEFEKKYKKDIHKLTPEIKKQLLELIRDFPKVWHNQKTPIREKKRIVRLIMKDVTLLKENRIIKIKIRWQGGATEIYEVPNPLHSLEVHKTPENSLKRIGELSKKHTIKTIVNILNRENYKPGIGEKFNTTMIQKSYDRYGIKSYYQNLRDQGKLTSKELAEVLGVKKKTILKWCAARLIDGYLANDKKQYLFDSPKLAPEKYRKLLLEKDTFIKGINLTSEV